MRIVVDFEIERQSQEKYKVVVREDDGGGWTRLVTIPGSNHDLRNPVDRRVIEHRAIDQVRDEGGAWFVKKHAHSGK